MRTISKIFFYLIITSNFVQCAMAQYTKSWTGIGANQSWYNPHNWEPEGVPNEHDDVLIPNISSNHYPVIKPCPPDCNTCGARCRTIFVDSEHGAQNTIDPKLLSIEPDQLPIPISYSQFEAAHLYNIAGATHNQDCMPINNGWHKLRDGNGHQLGANIKVRNVSHSCPGQGTHSWARFQGMEVITINGEDYYYMWGLGVQNQRFSGHFPKSILNHSPPGINNHARGCSSLGCNGRPADDVDPHISYTVSPQKIPDDWKYSGTTGPAYHYKLANYGRPSGHFGNSCHNGEPCYTNLFWSWISHVGSNNPLLGGGIVRCMMQEGEQFIPARVKPIVYNVKSASATNHHVIGYITLIYGHTHNNNRVPKDIYGWTVYSHTRLGKCEVRHLE